MTEETVKPSEDEDCGGRAVIVKPISRQFTSNDAFTPGNFYRKTLPWPGLQEDHMLDEHGNPKQWGDYIGMDYPHPKDFDPSLRVYDSAESEIGKYFFPRVTRLVMSKDRMNDERLPRPLIDCGMLPPPEREKCDPYFSHKPIFEVFPFNDPSREDTSGQKVLSKSTESALNAYYRHLYGCSTNRHHYSDLTAEIQRRSVEVIKNRIKKGNPQGTDKYGHYYPQLKLPKKERLAVRPLQTLKEMTKAESERPWCGKFHIPCGSSNRVIVELFSFFGDQLRFWETSPLRTTLLMYISKRNEGALKEVERIVQLAMCYERSVDAAAKGIRFLGYPFLNILQAIHVPGSITRRCEHVKEILCIPRSPFPVRVKSSQWPCWPPGNSLVYHHRTNKLGGSNDWLGRVADTVDFRDVCLKEMYAVKRYPSSPKGNSCATKDVPAICKSKSTDWIKDLLPNPPPCVSIVDPSPGSLMNARSPFQLMEPQTGSLLARWADKHVAPPDGSSDSAFRNTNRGVLTGMHEQANCNTNNNNNNITPEENTCDDKGEDEVGEEDCKSEDPAAEDPEPDVNNREEIASVEENNPDAVHSSTEVPRIVEHTDEADSATSKPCLVKDTPVTPVIKAVKVPDVVASTPDERRKKVSVLKNPAAKSFVSVPAIMSGIKSSQDIQGFVDKKPGSTFRKKVPSVVNSSPSTDRRKKVPVGIEKGTGAKLPNKVSSTYTGDKSSYAKRTKKVPNVQAPSLDVERCKSIPVMMYNNRTADRSALFIADKNRSGKSPKKATSVAIEMTHKVKNDAKVAVSMDNNVDTESLSKLSVMVADIPEAGSRKRIPVTRSKEKMEKTAGKSESQATSVEKKHSKPSCPRPSGHRSRADSYGSEDWKLFCKYLSEAFFGDKAALEDPDNSNNSNNIFSRKFLNNPSLNVEITRSPLVEDKPAFARYALGTCNPYSRTSNKCCTDYYLNNAFKQLKLDKTAYEPQRHQPFQAYDEACLRNCKCEDVVDNTDGLPPHWASAHACGLINMPPDPPCNPINFHRCDYVDMVYPEWRNPLPHGKLVQPDRVRIQPSTQMVARSWFNAKPAYECDPIVSPCAHPQYQNCTYSAKRAGLKGMPMSEDHILERHTKYVDDDLKVYAYPVPLMANLWPNSARQMGSDALLGLHFKGPALRRRTLTHDDWLPDIREKHRNQRKHIFDGKHAQEKLRQGVKGSLL